MSDRNPERKQGQAQPSAEADDQGQSDAGEGFLQRWSRRKHQAARQEGKAEDARPGDGDDVDDPGTADAAVEAVADQDPAETVAPEPPGDDDMPPLESIDQGGSVRDFFSPNVSKKLRGAALKRLFSQPEFSAPDMLEEYAGDYSKPTPLGDTVTAEMRYRAEQALKFAERKLKAAAERSGEDQTAAARPPAVVPEAAEHGTRSAATDAARHPNPVRAPENAPAADSEPAQSDPSETGCNEDADSASRPESSAPPKRSR